MGIIFKPKSLENRLWDPLTVLVPSMPVYDDKKNTCIAQFANGWRCPVKLPIAAITNVRAKVDSFGYRTPNEVSPDEFQIVALRCLCLMHLDHSEELQQGWRGQVLKLHMKMVAGKVWKWMDEVHDGEAGATERDQVGVVNQLWEWKAGGAELPGN